MAEACAGRHTEEENSTKRAKEVQTRLYTRVPAEFPELPPRYPSSCELF